jgi:hypothetical protein
MEKAAPRHAGGGFPKDRTEEGDYLPKEPLNTNAMTSA